VLALVEAGRTDLGQTLTLLKSELRIGGRLPPTPSSHAAEEVRAAAAAQPPSGALPVRRGACANDRGGQAATVATAPATAPAAAAAQPCTPASNAKTQPQDHLLDMEAPTDAAASVDF